MAARRTMQGVRAQAPRLQQARGFAADPHGPPKVNMWEDIQNPSNWKEEQIVLSILGTWAVVITSALKYNGKI